MLNSLWPDQIALLKSSWYSGNTLYGQFADEGLGKIRE